MTKNKITLGYCLENSQQSSSRSQIYFMAIVTSHGKQHLALKACTQCSAKQF